MYGCLFWSLKTLGESFPRSLRGETLVSKTLNLPPFVQFKNQAEFEVEFKSKVVDLIKMYNFGVLSFWSFSAKSKVILKIQISGKCPLFKLKSPIQNLFGILKNGQHESCRAWKVEQLSCWEFFKLFWKIKSNFGISNLPQFKIGIFSQFEFWISNCLAQIHPFPFQISLWSLKMFCSIQNPEQVSFWPKFDFYSKFGSN